MHTVKLWKSYKIKKASKLQNAPSGSLALHHGAGSQAPSPSCQEASGRTMVLVTVRIRNRLSHPPGADGYVNGGQSYGTFLCPKHKQRWWDLGAVWKLSDKSQVVNCTQRAPRNLHKAQGQGEGDTAGTASQVRWQHLGPNLFLPRPQTCMSSGPAPLSLPHHPSSPRPQLPALLSCPLLV